MIRTKQSRNCNTQKDSRLAQLIRVIRQRNRFITKVQYHKDGSAEHEDGIIATFLLKLDHHHQIQVPFHVGDSEEKTQRYVEDHPLACRLGMPVIVISDQKTDFEIRQQIVAFLRYHKSEQTDFSSIYKRATYQQKRRREELLYQLRDTESKQALRAI